MDVLDTPISYLNGLSLKRGQLITKEFGISTFGQMLQFYPLRYIDRTRVHAISSINSDAAYVQLAGKLLGKELRGEGRAKRLTATLADGTGIIELVWFNGINFMADSLLVGQQYKVFGKPSAFNGSYNLVHPEMDKVGTAEAVRGADVLQPLYSNTEKARKQNFTNKEMVRLQWALQKQVAGQVREVLPNYILQKYRLCSLAEAYAWIHFPADNKQLEAARRRLKFDELFFIQLKFLADKQHRQAKMASFNFDRVGECFTGFYNERLPFELTNAQKRVIKEIRQDTKRGWQMNRLVQGDVGSGKTVVALMSMLLAKDNDFQACMMAPTEILARQHYAGLSELLEGSGVRIDFLSGTVKGKQRKEVLAGVADGTIDILVGTHALIEDTVVFKNLGLAVIDEQHRFGVEQRAKLWRKNSLPPHVLVMTATPIPRTLAMSLYGDLDISVIDELPAGRKPITTIHLKAGHRLRMYGIMREEIAKGHQVYVVYPLIKESETLDLQNLEAGVEELRMAFPLPQYQVSIVHGQLPAADKEYEMARFVAGKTHIMVATTVIEVGVNVPNASVMVIENAERFGLSQLHQLRGRVGRGAAQSFCILMSGNKVSKEGAARLDAMVSTTDGFKIAEMDLKLRGPGDIAGTMQSGVLDLKLADIVADERILTEARNTVIAVFDEDPALQKPENRLLRQALADKGAGITYGKIS